MQKYTRQVQYERRMKRSDGTLQLVEVEEPWRDESEAGREEEQAYFEWLASEPSTWGYLYQNERFRQ